MYNKLLISTLLSLSLATPTYAGKHTDKVKQAVAADKKAIKEQVKLAYKSYLLKAMDRLVPKELAALNAINANLQKNTKSFEDSRHKASNINLTLREYIEKETSKRKIKRYFNYQHEKIQHLRELKYDARNSILNATTVEIAAKQNMLSSIKTMLNVCEFGVYAEHNRLEIPMQQPKVPYVDIRVPVYTNSEDAMNALGSTQLSLFENENPNIEAAMNTTALLGAVTTAEVTRQVLLVAQKKTVEAAFKGVFTSKIPISWGSYAVGTGVLLAIAVVKAIFGHLEMIKESNDIADSREYALIHTATPDFINKSFKSVCAPSLNQLQQVYDLISKDNFHQLKQLKLTIGEGTNSSVKTYNDANSAVQQKHQSIAQAYIDAHGKPSTEEEMEKYSEQVKTSVNESEEYKLLNKVSSEFNDTELTNIYLASILDFYLSNSKNLTIAYNSLVNQVQKLDIETIRSRYIYNLNLFRILQRDDMKEYSKIYQLYANNGITNAIEDINEIISSYFYKVLTGADSESLSKYIAESLSQFEANHSAILNSDASDDILSILRDRVESLKGGLN